MFKRNTAITGLTFGLVHKDTGAAITSGTVSGFITKDGGTQAGLTNSAAHKGNGQWSIDLTAAEMDAAIVGLIFTHTDAVPVAINLPTVTKLVSDLNDFDPASDDVSLADGAITAAKIANDAITTAKVQTPNDFKADVSGVAEKTDLPTNFGSMLINASGHVSRVTLCDTTTANADMRGTDSALTSLGSSAPADWINAAAIATNALDGKGDWNTTTPLSAAGVRSAVGLAAANLDTQLDGIPDAVLDEADGVETGVTLRQAMRLNLAAAAGKLSGAATTTIAIRDVGDTKDRITATVDADGNRTAVTTDVS